MHSCSRMELTTEETYEKMVIRAVLTDDTRIWSEANAYAQVHRFNQQQIQRCHKNVERWLRLFGVTKMEEREKHALLLMQSVVRRYLVLKRLKMRFDMYYRLIRLDNHEHCNRALQLQRILTCARESMYHIP